MNQARKEYEQRKQQEDALKFDLVCSNFKKNLYRGVEEDEQNYN